eukprot:gene8008-biopygen21108
MFRQKRQTAHQNVIDVSSPLSTFCPLVCWGPSELPSERKKSGGEAVFFTSRKRSRDPHVRICILDCWRCTSGCQKFEFRIPQLRIGSRFSSVVLESCDFENGFWELGLGCGTWVEHPAVPAAPHFFSISVFPSFCGVCGTTVICPIMCCGRRLQRSGDQVWGLLIYGVPRVA